MPRFPALLRRAIQRGGVSRVARDLFSGFSFRQIRSRVADFFGVSDPTDVEVLLELGRQARQAGIGANALEGDDVLDLGQIPVIPDLPPEIFAGGRVLDEVEIQFTNQESGESQIWFVRIPGASALSPNDLIDAANELLQSDFETSPGAFGNPADFSGVTIDSVTVIDSQRRF